MNSFIWLYLAVSLVANVALIIVVICCLVHISGLHKEMLASQQDRERAHEQNQKVINELKDGYEKIIGRFRRTMSDEEYQSIISGSDK